MSRTFIVLTLISVLGCDTSDKQDAKPLTQDSNKFEVLTREVAELRSEVKNAAATQDLIEKLTQQKHDALFDLVDSTSALEKKLKKAGKIPANSHLVYRALIVPGHDPLATLDLQTQKVTLIANFLRKQ